MKETFDDFLLKIEVWKMEFRKKNKFTAWLCDTVKLIFIVAVIILAVAVLTIGIKSFFESSPNHTVVMKMDQDHIEGTDLYSIEDTNLYYDQNTRVVYYVIFTQDDVYSRSFGLMSEYYSENLKKCRYIDGQIVEAE